MPIHINPSNLVEYAKSFAFLVLFILTIRFYIQREHLQKEKEAEEQRIREFEMEKERALKDKEFRLRRANAEWGNFFTEDELREKLLQAKDELELAHYQQLLKDKK